MFIRIIINFLYYFNNNYQIEDSGYESKEFVDTLIEGEMIEFKN